MGKIQSSVLQGLSIASLLYSQTPDAKSNAEIAKLKTEQKAIQKKRELDLDLHEKLFAEAQTDELKAIEGTDLEEYIEEDLAREHEILEQTYKLKPSEKTLNALLQHEDSLSKSGQGIRTTEGDVHARISQNRAAFDKQQEAKWAAREAEKALAAENERLAKAKARAAIFGEELK